MLAVVLFFVLFAVLYVLLGGPLPGSAAVRIFILGFGIPAGSAAGCFFLTALLFGTPLAGLPWGLLGWFLPPWAAQALEARRLSRLRAITGDFITSAAGLYSAGQTTQEVIRASGERMTEPLKTDFREMLAWWDTNPGFSFPEAFNRLAEKHKLPEFAAAAAIISASERAGGPPAAGKGLARLARALRQKERLLAERSKALVEVKFAGHVVIFILLAGLLADATALKTYFAGGSGRITVAAASAVAVGLIFMMRRLSRNKDLEGAV